MADKQSKQVAGPKTSVVVSLLKVSFSGKTTDSLGPQSKCYLAVAYKTDANILCINALKYMYTNTMWLVNLASLREWEIKETQRKANK